MVPNSALEIVAPLRGHPRAPCQDQRNVHKGRPPPAKKEDRAENDEDRDDIALTRGHTQVPYRG